MRARPCAKADRLLFVCISAEPWTLISRFREIIRPRVCHFISCNFVLDAPRAHRLRHRTLLLQARGRSDHFADRKETRAARPLRDRYERLLKISHRRDVSTVSEISTEKCLITIVIPFSFHLSPARGDALRSFSDFDRAFRPGRAFFFSWVLFIEKRTPRPSRPAPNSNGERLDRSRGPSGKPFPFKSTRSGSQMPGNGEGGAPAAGQGQDELGEMDPRWCS